MEKGMHLSIYHISQHWIKKNKINFPQRHQTYGYVWITTAVEPVFWLASETPTNLSSLEAHIIQKTTDSWVEVTPLGSRDGWYRVIRALHFWCLRLGKIDVITCKYLILNLKSCTITFIGLLLQWLSSLFSLAPSARQASKHCYMRSDNCGSHAVVINLE
jgi:hypothetical protein